MTQQQATRRKRPRNPWRDFDSQPEWVPRRPRKVSERQQRWLDAQERLKAKKAATAP